MKKTIAITILMVLVVGAGAQDTIRTRTLKSNYYCDHWIDTTMTWCSECGWGGQLNGYLIGKKFYHSDKDTLKIAGIAVNLHTPEHRSDWDTTDEHTLYLWNSLMDTCLDNSYEFLAIYQRDSTGTLVPVSDSLCVHYRDSTPAYIMDLDMRWASASSRFKVDPIAVHEVYFDEPILIVDSFYIFMTQRSFQQNVTDSNGRSWSYSSMPLTLLMLANGHDSSDHIASYGPCGWIYQAKWDVLFIFPILYTPEPDSPTPPIDTVAIMAPETPEAMVEILPNPADDYVLVTSSSMLERLEIYNNSGSLMLMRRASGTSAKVNTKALATGNYVIKAYTTQGVVSKKLIITR